MRLPALLGQQTDEGPIQRRLPGLRPQLGRGAGADHFAAIHRHQPVEALGLLHVGRRHQHAHARPAGTDAVDQFPELAARERIDAGRRLVENQQVGIVDQGAAQAELLLHAARQLGGRPVAERRQTRAGQQFGNALLALALALPEQPAEEIDVFEHRQRRVQIPAQTLRHVGDARLHRGTETAVADVTAQHFNLARLNLPRPGNQRQ